MVRWFIISLFKWKGIPIHSNKDIINHPTQEFPTQHSYLAGELQGSVLRDDTGVIKVQDEYSNL